MRFLTLNFFAYIGIVVALWIGAKIFWPRNSSDIIILPAALVIGLILVRLLRRKEKAPTSPEEEIFHQARKAAVGGDAEAQSQLASLYAQGVGVQQNPTEAVKWYRKAANQGLAEAQYNLALAYDNGDGLPEDYQKAIEWYEKASTQGWAAAQYNLAIKSINGEGTAIDVNKGVRLLQSAAGQGLEEAKAALEQITNSEEAS